MSQLFVNKSKFLVLLILLSIFGGIVISLSINKIVSNQQIVTTSNLTTPSRKEKCSYYGSLDKDFFLNKYTVHKEDTLLSIAKNELDDSSRVDELIELNKTWYPNLSIKKPYIEVGWELRIPPKYFPKSTGNIEIVSGNVLEDADTWIEMSTRRDLSDLVIADKTPQTRYLKVNSYQAGDCIFIVREVTYPGIGILAISPQDKNYFKDSTTSVLKSRDIKGKCLYYGNLEQDFFLNKYAVQSGDTLFSIAEKELTDISRVDEIINLNKTWYPHLSSQNPFIEIGWEIRIPPKFSPKSSGILHGKSGEVMEEPDKQMIMIDSYGPPSSIITGGYRMPKSQNTKYLGQNSFKVGDCVHAIVATSATDIHEQYILVISPQDKNYFKP